MKRIPALVCVLSMSVSMMILSAPAAASLIGDTVEACVAGPFPLVAGGDPTTCPNGNLFGTTPVTAVVGGGVEFTSAGGADPSKHIEVDLDDSSFSVSIFNDSPSINFQINGFELELSDLDWVGMAGEIVGVSLVGGNTLPVPSSLTFGADSISVAFPTFLMFVGESFFAEFTIRAEHSVPEPGTMALLVLGLLGACRVGAARRKQA